MFLGIPCYAFSSNAPPYKYLSAKTETIGYVFLLSMDSVVSSSRFSRLVVLV